MLKARCLYRSAPSRCVFSTSPAVKAAKGSVADNLPPKKPAQTQTEANKQARLAEFGKRREVSPQWTPYPSNVPPTISINDFVSTFGSLEPNVVDKGTVHTVCGRIKSLRKASSKLAFYDLECDLGRLQVFASKANFPEDSFAATSLLKPGDLIAVTGTPGKTKAGELSIFASKVQILAPMLQDVPDTLTDYNMRYRNRYLDLLVNPRVGHTLRTRSKMITTLRRFLEARGFMEVETPILWTQPGGATARAFYTQSRAFGASHRLCLRIAPELFLKQLVIGGMHRVFEIGRVFRDEGVDATHNPEFTSCEFYQAFASYSDLMPMTEELLRDIVQQCTGSLRVQLPTAPSASQDESTEVKADESSPQAPAVEQEPTVIDFSQPFARLDIMSTLEKEMGMGPLPDPNSDASLPQYLDLCAKLSPPLAVTAPISLARVLDKLIGRFVEPLCTQPTFLMHHPVCMSPLSKSLDDRPGLTARFELFVAGKEICNSYSELNDPIEQRDRLAKQQAQNAIDDEAQLQDDDFCHALDYGLPPTAGWGIGLDRLCMLLTSSYHIREVLCFPIMKPRDPTGAAAGPQTQ